MKRHLSPQELINSRISLWRQCNYLKTLEAVCHVPPPLQFFLVTLPHLPLLPISHWGGRAWVMVRQGLGQEEKRRGAETCWAFGVALTLSLLKKGRGQAGGFCMCVCVAEKLVCIYEHPVPAKAVCALGGSLPTSHCLYMCVRH